MSLLNEMLRDLHRRQALPAGAPGNVLAGVSAQEQPDPARAPNALRQWIAVPMIAVAAVAAGYSVAPHLSGGTSEPLSTLTATAETDATVSAENGLRDSVGSGSAGTPTLGAPISLRMGTSLGTLAATHKPELAVGAPRDRQGVVTGPVNVFAAQVRQSGGTATLTLELDRAVEFRAFALDRPPRLVLDIAAATGALATEPRVAGQGPVKGVRAVSHDDSIRVVLDLERPVSIRRSALGESGERGHLLTVELTAVEAGQQVAGHKGGSEDDSLLSASRVVHRSEPEPVKTRQTVSMAKTAVKLEPRELAESRYRDAGQHLRAGRGVEAEAQLRAALGTDPDHWQARELLASLLLAGRRYDEAERWLRDGLALRPADVRLNTLHARLLMERGQHQEAVAVLQPLSPSIDDEPEFHAFKAALLHKTGQHGQAAGLYRELLQRRPETGVWWMGLAMALEAGGKSAQALAAYDRAAQLPDMSATLVRFVKARMRRLQERSS